MKCGICGVLDAKVRFDSCIEMTSGCVVCEMFESLHGAPYAVCVELKNFYLCVLFWRSFVCFVCDSVPVWVGGGWRWLCVELGWLLLGGHPMEVCVMGICGGSRDV